MGKIIVSEFVTLDGVIEAPGGEESLGERSGWSMPFFNEETAKIKMDDLFSSDALLMGRVTYQIHAAAWPTMTDEDGFADRMNSLPKYVVSTTLSAVEWNNSRLIKGNVPEAIKNLKQEVSRNILIDGGSDLVNSLMQHDLIDEYRLLVHPVVLGRGKRLFREGSERRNLRLIGARALSTGVVALTYCKL
ncbi:MAG TPA: dihydrofolate reductase family protein [Ktedonosporobacter sp.]|nr:dihydrofolate reductase family protein [Ktedonosporobacter sp.]